LYEKKKKKPNTWDIVWKKSTDFLTLTNLNV